MISALHLTDLYWSLFSCCSLTGTLIFISRLLTVHLMAVDIYFARKICVHTGELKQIVERNNWP